MAVELTQRDPREREPASTGRPATSLAIAAVLAFVVLGTLTFQAAGIWAAVAVVCIVEAGLLVAAQPAPPEAPTELPNRRIEALKRRLAARGAPQPLDVRAERALERARAAAPSVRVRRTGSGPSSAWRSVRLDSFLFVLLTFSAWVAGLVWLLENIQRSYQGGVKGKAGLLFLFGPPLLLLGLYVIGWLESRFFTRRTRR